MSAIYVPVTELQIGDVRAWGGVITGIRTSASGKTAWITDDKVGTEKVPATCRITLLRRAA